MWFSILTLAAIMAVLTLALSLPSRRTLSIVTSLALTIVLSVLHLKISYKLASQDGHRLAIGHLASRDQLVEGQIYYLALGGSDQGSMHILKTEPENDFQAFSLPLSWTHLDEGSRYLARKVGGDQMILSEVDSSCQPVTKPAEAVTEKLLLNFPTKAPEDVLYP